MPPKGMNAAATGAGETEETVTKPLSAKAEKAIADLFKMVDLNKNGVLEKAEQKKAKKKLHSMMPPRARWTWSDMDTDGDGKIDKNEWHTAMEGIAGEVGETELLGGIMRGWDDHPLCLARAALWEAAGKPVPQPDGSEIGKADPAAIEQAIEVGGADVNAVEAFLERRTAIYWAACGGHVEAVKMLIKWGAKVDQPHNHNRTALLLAAQRGHCDVMRVLLDKGADIRALFTITGSKIHNALHVAAHEGDVALMQTLLAGGADVKAIAHSGDLADRRIEATLAGKTPLEVAENADQKEAVEFLKSALQIQDSIPDGKKVQDEPFADPNFQLQSL